MNDNTSELFISDIHGQFDAFDHILRNGAGAIRKALAGRPGLEGLGEDARRVLATTICYPRERRAFELGEDADPAAVEAWSAARLPQVLAVFRAFADGLPAERVLSALPQRTEPLAAEIAAVALGEASEPADGHAAPTLTALCRAIQLLALSRIHVIGDAYDRGPRPDLIMQALIDRRAAGAEVDVQWGNHDIVWMGASLGQPGCIAHIVRICARYGNLAVLSDSYGINLAPLADFAAEAYADDPCVSYGLKGSPELDPEDAALSVKIQKAMAVIQFKVEGVLADAYPEFGLGHRKLLHLIDYERGTVVLDGVEHELTDKLFPTIDPADPFRLTPAEEAVLAQLQREFVECEELQRHMRFLLDAGSLYRIVDDKLLLHACVPLNADGSLKEVDVFGTPCRGRALYDAVDRWVRAAFDDPDPAVRDKGRDFLWYLWQGEGSPLFAKSKMATFELYVIADKEARKEAKNPFYKLYEQEDVVAGILADFGMDPHASRIVCGHVPVKAKDGENPVKCGGRVLVIDGGFSKAYQPTTGIAGYALVSDASGLHLDALEPLESTEAAVGQCADMLPSSTVELPPLA